MAPAPVVTVRVGINGFGRMGRLSARLLLLQGGMTGRTSDGRTVRLDLVHVNEVKGGADMAAYLLEFDSTHGRFPFPCEGKTGEDLFTVNSTSRIAYTACGKPEDIPWDKSGVDLVLECTGAFLTPAKLQGHFTRGTVKRILVSAPVDEGGVLNVVVGCNEHLITPTMPIVTAASCTTNCAAPVVGVIDRAFGIELGSISTVHNVTPTQSIMDVPNPGKKNDLRRARSGAVNLAPTTTGSAKAVAMIFPHLKGKLDGLAVRVPQQNASITDLVLLVKKDVTVDEVNAVLIEYARANPTIMGFETRPLVSTDFVNDPRSSIVDGMSTQVTGKRLVHVLSWYDNEWGYANRMVDIARILAEQMHSTSSQQDEGSASKRERIEKAGNE